MRKVCIVAAAQIAAFIGFVYIAVYADFGIADIVAWLYQVSGYAAFLLLIASVLPLQARFAWVKKWLGISAFCATIAHVFVFLWADFDFFFQAISDELTKPYIQLGILSFLALCAAFFRSLDVSAKFGKYASLIVCIALFSAIWHFVLIQKVLSLLELLLAILAFGLCSLAFMRTLRYFVVKK